MAAPVIRRTASPPASERPEAPWAFLGGASLPTDPGARAHEKRGRRLLLVSFLFCPCHVPVLLALVGALLGGTVVGAAVTGSALRVGVVLTATYAVLLWRGFRQIRRAKQIEAVGGTWRCTTDGCAVGRPAA